MSSILLITCVGSACGGAAVDPAEMADDAYPCVENAALYETAPDGVYTIDDRFADIARITPGGFGGFFLEGGRARAYLLDLSHAREAERVLREEFSEELGYSEISFIEGRYDWLQLISCYRVLGTGGVWTLGVTGTDIDGGRNRILLFVPHQGDHERRVRELIDELRVPQEMVVFERGEFTTL